MVPSFKDTAVIFPEISFVQFFTTFQNAPAHPPVLFDQSLKDISVFTFKIGEVPVGSGKTKGACYRKEKIDVVTYCKSNY